MQTFRSKMELEEAEKILQDHEEKLKKRSTSVLPTQLQTTSPNTQVDDNIELRRDHREFKDLQNNPNEQ